ncbi:hypothetical protein [Streptomyces sp. NBC_01276]|uniref:hypothetical protein n=1 Tax=Streptomyces sp. NBC_01276 TaxID=2903808 RepID=UPI00352F9315
MHVRSRLAAAAAAALLLGAALTGCEDGTAPPRPAPAPSGNPTASSPAPPPVAPAVSAPTAPAAPVDSPSPAPTPSPPPAAAPPPAPATRLSMSVTTPGGRLDLVRGGPAQEFTVTLRNGNSEAYRHLLLAFQMEGLVPGPGDTPGPQASLLLERRDPGTGRWGPAELRIAGDLKPYSLYEGGSSLSRDAVRTEHYRLRATAGGPTGSSPLMVRAIDTDAPEGTPEERERPAASSLPHRTRRAS